MARFAIITLSMVALLALALLQGGIWPALALGYMTVLAYFLDKLAALCAPDAPEGQEFPAGRGLSLLLGALHFPLLYGGVAALSAGMAPLQAVLCFAALGLYLGQVSNSNAHELIHQPDRDARRLGMLVYASVLFGHHASAHMRVHHIHAATDRDPNSARLGEGFYRFALRAWIGSFVEGYRAERARLAKRGQGGVHPYAIYGAGSAASMAVALLIGGGTGLLWLLGLSAYAQAQLLLSDYVQHYGLRRAEVAPGKWAPVGPAHSWNAPQGFTSALMLNAPRHSDHHARPARAYPGLELDRTAMPVLPHSLPVMATLALLPPVWRRIMDRRARRWSADFNHV